MVISSNEKPRRISENNTTSTTSSTSGPTTVNTSQFRNNDLQKYIAISEEIDRMQRAKYQSPRRRFSVGSLKATLTREELFETHDIINSDDDAFLTALEHQNSYDYMPRPALPATEPPQLMDMSRKSIDDFLSYLDADVVISGGDDSPDEMQATRCVTPARLAAVGIVSNTLAFLDGQKQKKAQSVPSPLAKPTPSKRIPQRDHFYTNIDALRKRYEPVTLPLSTVSRQPIQKPSAVSSNINNVNMNGAGNSKKLKSKVKEMAQLFNSKIVGMIQGGAGGSGNPPGGKIRTYQPLYNEFSPEPKPMCQPNMNTKPIVKPAMTKHQPRPFRAPTVRCSPVPSPRMRRKHHQTSFKSSTDGNCFVAEDVFRQLSVKDRVLLYQKFIEDMKVQHPQLGKHAAKLLANQKTASLPRGGQGEVIAESHGSVRHITQELEARHAANATSLVPTKNLNHSRRASNPNIPAKKEVEEEEVEVIPLVEDRQEPNTSYCSSLHVSTLIVTLKPSPSGDEKKPVRKPRNRRKTCSFNQHDAPIRIVEPCHKRDNTAIRSSLPTEAYAPPKKIRRTRAERLAPKMFFDNQQIERLFYGWLKEQNGVSFDITRANNSNVSHATTTTTLDETAKIKEATQNSNISLANYSEVTQKSAVERLLEEAIVRLETGDDNSTVKEHFAVEEKEIDNTAVAVNMPKDAQDQNQLKKSLEETPHHYETIFEPSESLPPSAKKSSRRLKKCIAPVPPSNEIPQRLPVPIPRSSLSTAPSSAISSAKHSCDESESGLSSMPKITSDESQPEQQPSSTITNNVASNVANSNSNNNAVFVKPNKPPRKKKLRRTLTWKKDVSIVESNTVVAPTTTTDSDSDYKTTGVTKPTDVAASATTPSNWMSSLWSPVPSSVAGAKPPKKRHNPLKLLFGKSHAPPPQPPATTAAAVSDPVPTVEAAAEELNKSLLLAMNSSRRIKDAYTLTVMSSPSPFTETDHYDSELPRTPVREVSRSWPSLRTVNNQQQNEGVATPIERPASTETQSKTIQTQRTLMDSFIDQGFETGSNELDEMHKQPRPLPPPPGSTRPAVGGRREKSVSPLFIKLPQTEREKAASLRRMSLGSSNRSSIGGGLVEEETEIDPFGFSTPVKGHRQQPGFGYNTNSNGNANNSVNGQKQLFSPIPTPLKSRRRTSIYENDPRRSSVLMQVIREDQPLNNIDVMSSSSSPICGNENSYFANATTADMPSNIDDFCAEFEEKNTSSSFWIKAGDFTVSLQIYHNSVDRLRLLYDIFSQKSCETKDLHFGIDDHKFSAHNSTDTEDISKRLQKMNGCSHYWFSTGDLAVPFNGQYMPGDRVKRLFKFLSDSLNDVSVANNNKTGNANVTTSAPAIRFGVDNFEFSNVPEFGQNQPKLSLESSYSMLVGLQAGNSNGLEGRSKYAWPNSQSNILRTSDLDHSGFDSEELDADLMGRPSTSPSLAAALNPFEIASMNSPDGSLDLFDPCYENDGLNQLFQDARKCNVSRTQTDKLAATAALTVPEMLETLQHQKSKLKTVEQRIREYVDANQDAEKVTNKKNLTSPEYAEVNGNKNRLGDSSEYMRQLRTIIAAISNIGRDTGYKACSLEQLENFMFFLSRYADICLDNCNEHMDQIIDALVARRSSMPPPENELQKSHEQNPAALSEHQLRVQASLQRLNIPDWYKQYSSGQQGGGTARSPDSAGHGGAVLSTYKPGNFTRKRANESGRWAGLNSKTTSLSSLGSQRSDRSPLLLSPSAHSHHGGGQQQQHHHPHHHLHVSNSGGPPVSGTGPAVGGGAAGFSRWSTSHLHSTQTSPSVSQRGSFSRGGPVNASFMSVASGQSGIGGPGSAVIRNSYRQPYLGWRSQERLSQRTPHERLASSLLSQQQQQRTSPTTGGNKLPPQQAVTPEIQSSIKEVTSAIVHYVNDQAQTASQRSRSTSPNSRKCWLESSFVGVRPLESPQTPVIEGSGADGFANSNNNNTSNSLQLHPHRGNSSSSRYTTTITTATGGPIAGNSAAEVLRMNGLSLSSAAAPKRSLSNASLEDVLASLLGLPPNNASASGSGSGSGSALAATGATQRSGPASSIAAVASSPAAAATATSASAVTTFGIGGDAFARPPTDVSASPAANNRHMPQQSQRQQHPSQYSQQHQLLVDSQSEQQVLRRRSEGDAPKQQQQQQQQQNAGTTQSTTTASSNHAKLRDGSSTAMPDTDANTMAPARRVSLGDSPESNNKTTSASAGGGGGTGSGDLQQSIKCRNGKCERTATAADAKKYYKSCHNCTHLYCSRECRRAHWEKHRKACLHSRASNLCRQVLATCKDDLDSQRHLSLLARKGCISQGRGVVRVLFRSADRAESFTKHGFQCMGEASYVRWPDLMPAEMGLELYSELLKLSTEYKPDSKMLIYVAICVVSEAPGMGQAPVRWERQLVSRCAKLKLCKTVLAELELQQQALQQQPVAVVAIPEPTTEILILTFNPSVRTSVAQGEMILSNILDILSRRGVLLRKHYPEIHQRLQAYAEGQTDKFNPVTLHPRDTQTGQSFVCIIMPVHTDSEIIRLPSAADGGNRVTTIDVGSPAALAELDDDELLTRSAS